ncbi:VgrG-related protein [Nostoc sp. FACHB-152]|uniref:VgrG-related protein n=1 Tax=unclassified Nostoc TaxID=2593658 RepID=UPI001685EC17|nr:MULTISPECIES: VgrG-related protein [unclassified Nostoc]MBD2449272.1 VgrG-related protein [Nostoc sp. FACHB-152]MBD2470450.1 VgrG-related protein [Nostoc sp. FACHB-145]
MPDRSLYLSEPKIQIEGQDASPELVKDILQITVEESLHLPAMFTLVIHNSYLPTVKRSEYKEWRHQKLFEIGKQIKIGFVSSTTQDSNFKKKLEHGLIEGEITGIETHFNEKTEAPIIIRGYDISHRLHRGRYNRSFLNQTDSDIVKKIANEVGILLGKIDASGVNHEYVFQENQTNMEFLRERAARIGYELFIEDGKLNFRQPESKESLNLKWLDEISKFSVRVTNAEQVNAVEVRSWDYTRKKLIASEAKSEKVITETGNGKGSKTSTAFKGKPPSPKMIVVDQPVATENEAKKMAQALCDELGGEFVYADAQAYGNPQIRPGRIINLEGMGDRYSGKYYVTETRHFYTQRVYTTDFSVRGLRPGNLFSTLSTQTHLQPGQTFLVGIVTNNKDPKGWGRVKVKFPTLTEQDESHWARVVAIGAGPNRGFDCLPEINDEVLVGFEHGDIHRPYILGGVWNGKDAPPEKVDDSVVKGVRLRTFKTRTGHTLQYIEEDKAASKAGIRLQTTKGHKIYLNDSDQFIEIKTTGGHSIKMDDRGKSITIETTGGHSIKMSDATQSVTIKSTGNLDINATGIITIKGSLIKLN